MERPDQQALKIYVLIGNEVYILVDEYKPAGIYEVEFDATELTMVFTSTS